MTKVYEYLTEIIPDFPMVHMMYLGHEDEEFIGFYEEYAKEKGFIFDVRVFEKISNKYEKVDIKSQNYHTNAYKYDTLFLNLKTVPKEHINHIFERVYASMKNAGGVVLFLPRDDDFSLEAEYILGELNFVAINPMDLSDEKKIIYAKKMHGWGGAR